MPPIAAPAGRNDQSAIDRGLRFALELARKLYRPDPELRPVSLREVSVALGDCG